MDDAGHATRTGADDDGNAADESQHPACSRSTRSTLAPAQRCRRQQHVYSTDTYLYGETNIRLTGYFLDSSDLKIGSSREVEQTKFPFVSTRPHTVVAIPSD